MIFCIACDTFMPELFGGKTCTRKPLKVSYVIRKAKISQTERFISRKRYELYKYLHVKSHAFCINRITEYIAYSLDSTMKVIFVPSYPCAYIIQTAIL